MFKMLNKRFTKILFLTVFTLSLISCLTIGIYTSYIAVSDFQEKTIHVSKYYSNRLKSKLDGITETINLVTTQGLFDMIEKGEGASDISEVLRYMTLGNNNIDGATVVTADMVNNARDAKVKLTENFGNDYRKMLKNYTGNIWLAGYSKNSAVKDSLIYIMPKGNETFLLLSAPVDSIFWDFEHNDNVFLKNSDIYIIDENGGEIAVYQGSGKKNTLKRIKEKQKSSSDYVVRNNEIYYYYKIPDSKAYLAMYIPKTHSAAQLHLLTVLFVLIFAAVSIAFIGVLRVFVSNITYPLEVVCREMAEQQENYKRIAENELKHSLYGKTEEERKEPYDDKGNAC